MAAPRALSSTEIRLATRRAIAALRRAPRLTAERALCDHDENDENSPALEQLALFHLRQMAVDLEDEVREYLSTGAVHESGLVSFLLPSSSTIDRSTALADLLNAEYETATQRSGALRALDRPSIDNHRPRPAAHRNPLNETFTVAGAGPPGIPRITGFDGIRDFSENVSARGRAEDIRQLQPTTTTTMKKKVVIVEDDEDGSAAVDDESDEEPMLVISGRAEEKADIDRVVRELREELVADRSFVATFRSGDMASTAREIERRLKARDDSFGVPDLSREEEEQEGMRRDQRSKREKYPELPLLESTPLKKRAGGGISRRPDASTRNEVATSADVREPPERVTIGVGTSACDLPPFSRQGDRQSTGVQCDIESSSLSHSLPPGGISCISSDSCSFGQVPDRLLQQLQPTELVVEQPVAAAVAASSIPRPAAVRVASPISSPDSLVRGLLAEVALSPPPPQAPPAPEARRMMYAASSDSEEPENTLENLDSIRDSL